MSSPSDLIPKLALVGCGGIAAMAHVPQLWDPAQAEIRYITDIDQNRAQALRRHYEIPYAEIADLDQVLADGRIDGVIVAAWPSVNTAIAIAAIEANKHVLLQKPAALSVEDCHALLRASQNSTKNILALPLVEAARGVDQLDEVIRSGHIGHVNFARVRVSIPGPLDYHRDVRQFFGEPEDDPGSSFDWNYAEGAGCAADMGPYGLSLVHRLFGGGSVNSVWKDKRDFEEMCQISLTLPPAVTANKRVLCSVELAWSQFPGRELCVVAGDLGTVSLTPSGEVIVQPHRSDRQDQTRDAEINSFVLPVDPSFAQIKWLKAIRDNRQRAFEHTLKAASWITDVLSAVRDA